MKFLVVEDNENLNSVICEMLQNYQGGSSVDYALDGERGLELALSNQYDLIVLDLMLPKLSGRSLLIKLRQHNSTPILVLTALSDVNAKVDVLNKGADDYLIKPFENSELIARISSILRRSTGNFGSNKYSFKNLEIDFFEKTVKIDGERKEIVAKMYDLFEYLVRNKEVIISKDSLFNRIWGFESETVSAVVEVYISKLRKILSAGGLAGNLVTIKNAGYMWSEKS